MNILVFGATGWIGSQLVELLSLNKEGEEGENKKSNTLILSKVRLENYGGLVEEINKYKDLTHCLITAGITGVPNVDYCEDHKQEVIRTNVIGTSIIGDMCNRRNIHVTYVGTGCIFEYDDNHSYNILNNVGFKEEDKPNFDKSFYSYSKIMTENILKQFESVLILRLRMPLSDDLHPRNFITKITKYKKVVDVPNSMSILSDLLPLIPVMMEDKTTGVLNFTNPGLISHNQILDLYKQYIDKDFVYENFSIEEQSKILKAGRSNNYLDTTRLQTLFPSLPDIQTSIHNLFKRMQEKEGKKGEE